MIAKGKVRDIYENDQETLLLVTHRPLSAFDVIMDSLSHSRCGSKPDNPVLDGEFRNIVSNHIISADTKDAS
jgi:phosphoribosylaminoimidazole-succinocarboxamide synthase